MALLPKKTYSRRNNDLSVISDKEKENVDPFDELLSSPLKQEVQFQPLSFWGKKVRRLECKDKNKKVDCALFKGSDSDEPYSPCRRKRRAKAKFTESKARTLQPKNSSHKLSNRRKNYSTSCISRTKLHKSILSDKNETLVSPGKIEKYKGWSPDNTSYANVSMEETLTFSLKSCDASDFLNLNRHVSISDSIRQINSVRSKRNCKETLCESADEENFIMKNSKSFKIYEDISTSKQQLGELGDETVVGNSREDSCNGTIDKSVDETLVPYSSIHDSFKFVSVRRYFNYPDCISGSHGNLSNFVEFSKNDQCPVQLWDEHSNLKLEDTTTPTEYVEEIVDKTIINYNGSPVNTVHDDKSAMSTLSRVNCTPCLDEGSREISLLEFLRENSLSDSEFLWLNSTELEDLIQELLNENALDALEASSTSDDTPSSFIDEETVINVGLKPAINDSPHTGSDIKKDTTQSFSNGVSVLTTSMSELSIKNSTGNGASEPETEKVENVPHVSDYEDKEKNSFSAELRNVTTKRRGGLNRIYERSIYNRLSRAGHQDPQKIKETDAGVDFDQSVWMPGRASLDWNKSISFINPVFESTRVFDMGPPDRKRCTNRFENESILEGSVSGFDRTYALKPGKKWFRSRSVLKQLQNGTIGGGVFESTRVTGRKFESFVQEMMEMQNEKSALFTSLVDATASKHASVNGSIRNTRLSCFNSNKTILELGSEEEFNDSVPCNETRLEKSSLNHTVRVIQPEEKPSAFRSALGLDNDNSLLQEDSAKEESSAISARDFILIQCGQEDVLPFEEYFNERTLENCRKIGEGVYGEVFMCSDTVIKIIPIEGADKVNGEPQKTFAEIISEVVIASKLSNLRKGKKHRTDGFSEMKRCWCVKGKYPKHLLRLWDEYDQQGSGSENDSPIMFKDDQLYIILELANGGKDLESFVFSSSAQSLSVFIQAAFSLAVAEKAFEFEHRDLHWGNVLISETKEKFAVVSLDGVEYKIPTKGVKVCIIDFTLSRINHEGCCIFNDLSVDPSLFASEGDYQFEIYRLMLKEVKNDWSLFRPKTNLFWLHYTLDKMVKMVRYKNKKSKVHIKHLKDLKTLEGVVLDHEDSTDFVSGNPLTDVVNKL